MKAICERVLTYHKLSELICLFAAYGFLRVYVHREAVSVHTFEKVGFGIGKLVVNDICSLNKF